MRARLGSEAGQTTVEYVLALGLIVLLVAAVALALSGLGGPLTNLMVALF